MNKCKICGRELGTVNVDHHHLLPKTFKGKSTDENLIPLHKICHRKIHSIWTERELMHYYNTIEHILENEEIQKFVKWVAKKEPGYYSGSNETTVRHGKRF
jgi:5-methylcytosine-specific restriction endonuclease McrA